MINQTPYLLYSDGKGNVFEDKTLYAVGRTLHDAIPINNRDWIELPEGGQLYDLPKRIAIGLDVKTKKLRLCNKGFAVAAFVPPAYTILYLAAYEKQENAPLLPLFCYSAVAWFNNKFYIPAVRIDLDIRQECFGFDEEKINIGLELFKNQYPNNRLVKHLAENCCKTYNCPASRNYFMQRWECPIPVSMACNSNCIGCISFQPQENTIPSTQDRLSFKPSVEEIVEYTVPHLEQANFPIISFGQGCEGEPTLMWQTIKEAIIEIRKHTQKGIININTNGSKPDALEELFKVGLDSIRVSLNSAQKNIYTAYYKPNNYEFEDLIKSLQIADKYNKWSSINYFVFPGMTDSKNETKFLKKLIVETNLKMIQWRNFNIDADWYLSLINQNVDLEYIGIKNLMKEIKTEFPNIKYGYFNPSKERMKNFETDFAH